jgi:hypothetical protein
LPAWSALWGFYRDRLVDCERGAIVGIQCAVIRVFGGPRESRDAAVNFSLSLLQWLVADRDVYLAIAVIWIRS